MEIRTISDIIYNNIEDRERMEKMNQLYYDIADYVKKHDEKAYDRFYQDAECILYSMSQDEAMDIVRHMRPSGEHWSIQQIKDYLDSKNITEDCLKFYVCMNMAYNDFYRTAKLYDINDADFYYNIAHDFIHDEDGGKFKVEKYFKH